MAACSASVPLRVPQMPSRKAPPPPEIPLSRDEWTLEFAQEMARLRPYLVTNGSAGKIAHQTALVNYKPDLEPKVAARRYHTKG